MKVHVNETHILCVACLNYYYISKKFTVIFSSFESSALLQKLIINHFLTNVFINSCGIFSQLVQNLIVR